MRSVVVLALDDVIAFDLATAVETFRWARLSNESAAYELTVAGPASPIRSGPISIGLDHGVEAFSEADTIIIPGRDDPTRSVPVEVLDALNAAHHRGVRLASICVGALDLALTGLLDGRRATTHWRAVPLLRSRHPAVIVDPAVLYVDEGSILTSAGAAAGLDLCLHMIEADYGAAVALDASRAAVMSMAREGGQAQFISQPPAAMPEDASLALVLEWMQTHLSEPLTLSDIANAAHLSVRSLSRRFRDQLGLTPLQWLTAARLRLARSLLETTDHSIEAIAVYAGLGSAANLRARFSADLATSPSAYRRSFASRTRPTAAHAP